jgi:hypothetical protein
MERQHHLDLLADPAHTENWGYHRSVAIWVKEFINNTAASIVAAQEAQDRADAGIEDPAPTDYMERSPDPNEGINWDEDPPAVN